jgi:hypothetical protein
MANNSRKRAKPVEIDYDKIRQQARQERARYLAKLARKWVR